jgi:hypothetical protein
VAAFEEAFDGVRADVASAAGDQDVHSSSLGSGREREIDASVSVLYAARAYLDRAPGRVMIPIGERWLCAGEKGEADGAGRGKMGAGRLG